MLRVLSRDRGGQEGLQSCYCLSRQHRRGLILRLLLPCSLLLSFPLLSACSRSDSTSAQEEQHTLPALWLPEQRASYAFSLRSLTSLAAFPESGEMKIEGILDVQVPRSSAETQVLELRIREARLLTPEPTQSASVTELLEELEQAFAIELQHEVLSAYLEPEHSTLLTFGLRRQLASVLQRARPSTSLSASQSSWSGEEWDTTGRFQVAYESQGAKRSVFTWKKLKYLEVLARTQAHPVLQEQPWTPQIISSQGKLTVGKSGLESVEREEVLETELTPDQKLRSQYQLRLSRLDSEATSPSWKLPATLVRRDVQAPPPHLQTDALDQLRVGGKTLEEVLQTLGSDTADSPLPEEVDFRTRQAAFHALVGLFRTQADSLPQAEALIEQSNPHTPLLFHALAAASTTASLTTLSQAALNPQLSEKVRQTAAAHLLRAESPPTEALPLLQKFLREPLLQEHGLLGLGTFSRLWKQNGQNEASQQANELIEQQLAQASTKAQKRACLLAIANTGDAGFYEQALALQEEQDPQVREAAILAVRLMRDSRVEPRLVELLKTHSTLNEAITILSSLAHRTTVQEATVQLVKQHTQAEKDAAERREATMTLAAWQKQWPQIRETLSHLAEQDPDARVREAAQRALLRSNALSP